MNSNSNSKLLLPAGPARLQLPCRMAMMDEQDGSLPASGLPSVNVSADGALPMPDFFVGGGDFSLSCTVQITDLVHEGMMLKSTTKCRFGMVFAHDRSRDSKLQFRLELHSDCKLAFAGLGVAGRGGGYGSSDPNG